MHVGAEAGNPPIATYERTEDKHVRDKGDLKPVAGGGADGARQ